jgi:hypothetical protein
VSLRHQLGNCPHRQSTVRAIARSAPSLGKRVRDKSKYGGMEVAEDGAHQSLRNGPPGRRLGFGHMDVRVALLRASIQGFPINWHQRRVEEQSYHQAGWY